MLFRTTVVEAVSTNVITAAVFVKKKKKIAGGCSMISVIFEQIFNTVVTEAACLLNGADHFFISQIEPKRQTPRLCTRLIQNFEKYRSKRFRLLKQEQGIWACTRFFCNGST